MIDVRRNRCGAIHQSHSTLVGVFIATFAVFVFGSCASDDNPAVPEMDGEEIPIDLTEPVPVIESHVKAITKKNYAAYAALLDSAFEFFPLEEGPHDGPWIGVTSWGPAAELSMIQHMFDPNFQNKARPPVQTIHFQASILDVRSFENGDFEVTCSCQGHVLTGEDDGWAFDTRLVFHLVLREGFLRIQHINESSALRPGNPRAIESASWGSIKSLYYE